MLKYLGNSEHVFIPGVINHCPVKVGRELFIKDWRYINTTVKSIVVGEGVQLIEDAAFYNCARVEHIFVPDTVKSIGSSAFFGCYMLRHDIIISNTLFCAAPTIHRRRYRVKENISEIAYSAFTLGFNIQEIEFSSNIRKMGDLPSGMKTFIMPDSVEEISPNFCSVMTKLEKIVLSSRLKEIPEGAFSVSGTLEFLNEAGTEINSSIKTISDNAFTGTMAMDTLILPTSLETIGVNAFNNLTVESLTIPSTIESIGSSAFASMPETSTITVNKAEGSFNAPTGWQGKANVIYNG